MGCPAGTADLIRRDTPEGFVKYMCANPVHFREMFGKPLTQDNLESALLKRFPGVQYEREDSDMARRGTCGNCERKDVQIVAKGHCYICYDAGRGLDGADLRKALAAAKKRIQDGNFRQRCKKQVIVDIKPDNGGAFSGDAQAAPNRKVEETARQTAESGAAPPKSVREVPGSPPSAQGKVEAQLRGLLRLIDETAKMGLATEITVSIRIGG